MSEIETTDGLLNRVERLEQSNRRLRRVIFSFIAIFCSVNVIGWSSSLNEMYEGVFHIQDKMGNVKGALTYDPETQQGKLMLGGLESVNSDGSYDFDLRKMVRIFGGKGDENWGVVIHDKNGHGRILLGYFETEDGNKSSSVPILAFLDEKGDVVSYYGEKALFESDKPNAKSK